MSLMDRLFARVLVDDNGCWLYTGARTTGGYGSIGLGSRAAGTGYTHRVAYEHHVGPIPAGMDLDHLCRVRACCNPEHLEPVTRRTNLMRGETQTKRNATKTHCKRGHEFTPENTRKDGHGRQCRTCDPIRRGKEATA